MTYTRSQQSTCTRPPGQKPRWDVSYIYNPRNIFCACLGQYFIKIIQIQNSIYTCFYPNCTMVIATKFCTCHDSYAAVTWAKFCSDLMARNENTVNSVLAIATKHSLRQPQKRKKKISRPNSPHVSISAEFHRVIIYEPVVSIPPIFDTSYWHT